MVDSSQDFFAVLSSYGSKARQRLFRPSGWLVGDDMDAGVSAGVGIEVGAGFMEMDVVDLRSSDYYAYELKGSYLEVGLGLAEKVQISSFFKKLSKWITAVKPGSDFGLPIFFGGSVGQLALGLGHDSGQLSLRDFKDSSWLYIGASVGFGYAGGMGLIFLQEDGQANAPPKGMWDIFPTCLACVYWNGGATIGAEMKVFARRIIMSSCSPTDGWPLLSKYQSGPHPLPGR